MGAGTMIPEDLFLGYPLSYWVNLKVQIEQKGTDFDAILVSALVENEQLKRMVNKLHREFRSVNNAIHQVTREGDFILGTEELQ
jgi:hypothetical protein